MVEALMYLFNEFMNLLFGVLFKYLWEEKGGERDMLAISIGIVKLEGEYVKFMFCVVESINKKLIG